MRLEIFLNDTLQQNVAEADTSKGLVRKYVNGKLVTERGRVEVTIRRVSSEFIEGDTKILEDTI